MGLLDKFRRKKEEKQLGSPAMAVSTQTGEPQPAASAEIVPHGADILLKPLLSEKGTHFASTGRYVFVVDRAANKPEIKKSIQKIYKVHVEGVRIVNLPSKKRRYGRTSGETSAFKKAIITLKKGEKIPGIVESVG